MASLLMNTFGVKQLEFQKETVDNLPDGKNVYLSVKNGSWTKYSSNFDEFHFRKD